MGSCIWEKAYSALCMKVGCDEVSVDEFDSTVLVAKFKDICMSCSEHGCSYRSLGGHSQRSIQFFIAGNSQVKLSLAEKVAWAASKMPFMRSLRCKTAVKCILRACIQCDVHVFRTTLEQGMTLEQLLVEGELNGKL